MFNLLNTDLKLNFCPECGSSGWLGQMLDYKRAIICRYCKAEISIERLVKTPEERKLESK
jgi:hypothetical protein